MDDWAVGAERAIHELATSPGPPRKLIALLDGWARTTFHYHAQVAGAQILSRKPGHPFASETWIKLGSVRLMTIVDWGELYDALEQFDVAAGDELWLYRSRAKETMRDKFPPGLDIVAIDSPGGGIEAFRFIEATAGTQSR